VDSQEPQTDRLHPRWQAGQIPQDRKGFYTAEGASLGGIAPETVALTAETPFGHTLGTAHHRT
jgi:hypothetical protein